MHNQRLAILAAATLGMLATFLPWVKAPIIGSMNGTHGVGWITFALYLIPLVICLTGEKGDPVRFPKLYGALIPAALAILFGIIKIIEFNSKVRDMGDGNSFGRALSMGVSIQFGLYLVILAGIAMIVAAFVVKGNSLSVVGTGSIRLSSAVTHIFCRTCSNNVLAKAIVCTKCGCKPLDGNSYCYSCGCDTNPNAIICVSCGVSLTGKRISNQAVSEGNDVPLDSPLTHSLMNGDAFNVAIKKPSFWAAVVILISFFLPWIDLVFMTVSGWEIRDLIRYIKANEDEGFTANEFINLLYFLPVLSLLLISGYLLKTPYLNKRLRTWKILAGLFPWLFFISMLLREKDVTDWLAYGLYFTLAAGGLLLYDGIIGSRKSAEESIRNIGAEGLTYERPSVAVAEVGQKALSEEEMAVGYQLMEEQEKNDRLKKKMLVLGSIATILMIGVILFLLNGNKKDATEDLGIVNNVSSAVYENLNPGSENGSVENSSSIITGKYASVVTSDFLALKDGPSVSATRITKLYSGERVYVIDKTSICETIDGVYDCWYKVSYENNEGYVFGAYLMQAIRNGQADTEAAVNEPIIELANEVGSGDRKEILDAIRPRLEKVLKEKLSFRVFTLKVQGNYAFMQVEPKRVDGSDFDYANTEFRERVENGDYDETIIGLCKLEGGVWYCIDYKIGCMDVCYEDWPKTYGISNALIGRVD